MAVPVVGAGSTGKVLSVRVEPGCVFCGIVAGEISSIMVAQSERAVAFMDINPVTPGHTLVVPRSHAIDVFDISSEELAACSYLAQQIAGRVKDRLGADGVNLLNSSGEAAYQTVFHFHLHVIPRYQNRSGRDAIGLPWKSVPSDPDEIERIGNLLS